MSVWTAQPVSRCARSRRFTPSTTFPRDCEPYLVDNEDFFTQVLPGRDAPLGSPGGAAKLGPLGVDTPLVAGQPLPGPMSSGRRRDVLAALRRSESPMSIVAIADVLQVHPNTVRFHLRHLVDRGQVEQVEPSRSSPGRPPLMFRAREGMDPTAPRNYRLLAEVLTRAWALNVTSQPKRNGLDGPGDNDLSMPTPARSKHDDDEAVVI